MVFLACIAACITQVGGDIPIPSVTSGFTATSTHAQVVEFCDALAAKHDCVIRTSLGTSSNGKDLPLLIITSPPLDKAGDYAAQVRERAASKEALVLLAIGNIHAGEVDGKEGIMILAEQIARTHPAYLERTVLLFAPIYNADGNEPFSLTSRPGQVGPVKGQGSRENAQGLDLNRDFIKIDAPETRALIGAFNNYDPHIFIDAHTTDGSYHRYVMTYDGAKVPAGNPEIIAYSRDTFFPAVRELFKSQEVRPYYDLWNAESSPTSNEPIDSFWYGNFDSEWEPGGLPDDQRKHTRWETFPAEARYSTNYAGLRGRISVLTESYSYATYRARIGAQVAFIQSVIAAADARRAQIRSLLTIADSTTVRMGETGGDAVPIRTRMKALPESVTIPGYVERVEKGRSIPSTELAEYTVEHYADFEATHSVARPIGYVLLPSTPATVIDRLHAHGVIVEKLEQAARKHVQTYTVTGATAASRVFQQRVLVKIEANISEPADHEIPAGSYVVLTAQPLGNLLVYLLEPTCEDGLAAWGFFDDHLREKYPIMRIVSNSKAQAEN